ncbi:hypothetical protein QA649_02630 [Bradyrhizobium sp. CB1717]|uniref:hypothetical protein n=1 Tax=Bradyrhizobium sp. CB1717 TaxID=3039154 RepID=UPI0024B1FC70|nr:hypothetical protein [Bradyrhizobium sp. CB1717]WFU25161.1 hypothetical protein QA649_02630 [Bradyrhizobium sp. CB1717]
MSLFEQESFSSEELSWLKNYCDKSFRGDRFRSGFYITHHFGDPAFIFTAGSEVLVIGTTLKKLIWPYFTKVFLTLEAEKRGDLHLKAACVELNGKGILLIGRGSGGKTVMLKEACKHGAIFVANTHCVVSTTRVIGVQSPVRVRDDPIFADQIRASGAQPHIEADEYTLRHASFFEHTKSETTPNIMCVIDYRPERPALIRRMTIDQIYGFAELFAFPTVTYGIKDDILASVQGDHFQLAEMYGSMKAKLKHIVSAMPVFYVSIDATKKGDWAYLRESLAIE